MQPELKQESKLIKAHIDVLNDYIKNEHNNHVNKHDLIMTISKDFNISELEADHYVETLIEYRPHVFADLMLDEDAWICIKDVNPADYCKV